MKIKKSCVVGFTLLLGTVVPTFCGPSQATDNPTVPASQTPPTEYSLEFNPSHYKQESLTFEGNTVTFRAYEQIVYVKHPVDTTYQSMNIYIPEAYYEGKALGNFTADTAPIFLPNTVGGYLPGAPGSPGQDFKGESNAALVALSKGYVVAEPGARGRTTQKEDGLYTGKAPACIIDLKAAVRYLRYNDQHMPGDAEKIISNGTSAGGALSALLGATGNNQDYAPYLKALGAAEVRDDIFAVSAYCPITNLEHADMAYEWLFNGVNEYRKMIFPGGAMPSPGQGRLPMPPQGIRPSEVTGVMTPEQRKLSDELKPLFPAYVNQLGLKKADGALLTLDGNGNGSFKDYVKAFVMASAQKAVEEGADVSALPWLTLEGTTVTDMDFDSYVKYAGRMKTTPAFDGVDVSTGENDLFGTPTGKARHFTPFAKDHSTTEGTLAETAVVKLMNPMNYIGTPGTTTARYWRIRHGAVDRDTSLAIPVILATTLANRNFQVDFAVPWGKGHSGDYDLAELFAWIDHLCAPAKAEK